MRLHQPRPRAGALILPPVHQVHPTRTQDSSASTVTAARAARKAPRAGKQEAVQSADNPIWIARAGARTARPARWRTRGDRRRYLTHQSSANSLLARRGATRIEVTPFRVARAGARTFPPAHPTRTQDSSASTAARAAFTALGRAQVIARADSNSSPSWQPNNRAGSFCRGPGESDPDAGCHK